MTFMVDLHPALGARAALIAEPPHELVTVFTPCWCLEVGALEVMDTFWRGTTKHEHLFMAPVVYGHPTLMTLESLLVAPPD